MLIFNLLLFLCNKAWTLDPFATTSSSVLDINSLTYHVLHLEQSLSDMRSQAKTQDKKYAAVLSSILSKLTTTTDELNSVKSDLKSVKSQLKLTQDQLKLATDVAKSNMTSCLAELEAVKHAEDETKIALVSVQEEVRNLTRELQSSESVMALLESDVSSLQRDVKAVENTSNAIGLSLLQITDLNAAFQVKLSGGNHSETAIQPFDQVRYVSGQSYDRASRMFTAPVDGSYLFWANILFATNGTWFDCRVYINNGHINLSTGFVRLQQEESGDLHKEYRVASTMVVSHLDKGDMVHFAIHSPCTDIVYGYDVSSYGGTLLHAV